MKAWAFKYPIALAGILCFLENAFSAPPVKPDIIGRLSDLDQLTSPGLPASSSPALEPRDHTPHIITQDVIKDIEDALGQEISSSFKIDLDQELQCQGPCVHHLKNFVYTPESSRFRGEVHFKDSHYTPLNISGSATLMVSIPVPTRVLNAGHIIDDSDLIIVEVPLKRATKAIASQKESLIGTEVRMLPLRPGLPVRLSDVSRPQQVKKGHMVEAHLTTPNMNLKIDALALDNGSMGDVIRIQNTRSEKMLRGRIVGPNTLIIENTLSTPYQDRSLS